jgi:hypothetical protein
VNKTYAPQPHEMLDAAHARIPETAQAFAAESLSKSRGVYEKMSALAKDNANVVEELLGAAQAKAKTIGEKVVDTAVTNTEAAFAAAHAIARAKTLPEAARLQLEFVQSQLAVAGNLTKDLFAMQTEAARQTYAALSAAAKKSFAQVKKTA